MLLLVKPDLDGLVAGDRFFVFMNELDNIHAQGVIHLVFF
jgi:hypothetical protein